MKEVGPVKATLEWTEEKKRFVIKNYGKIPTEQIAKKLGTTSRIIRCKAAYLRKKGEPVMWTIHNHWKDPEEKERLMSLYGTRPTHEVARRFKTTVGAIYRAAGKIKLPFRGNDIYFTFPELAELLKIDPTTLKRWTRFGLQVRGYTKDGCTRPRTPKDEAIAPQPFGALIDLKDLKKFLIARPEAFNLARLDSETRHVLELNNLLIPWTEKQIRCKHCKKKFWTKLKPTVPFCPHCKLPASKWAVKYR